MNVITGRGARIQHIDTGDGALCGSHAATEATGRFTKLPICSKCDTVEKFLAELEASEEQVTVRLSARVARWMADHLAETAPKVSAALGEATLVRNGRGYSARVTCSESTARELLAEMKLVSAELRSGERTTTGMGFREEAVAKGIEHITADLEG